MFVHQYSPLASSLYYITIPKTNLTTEKIHHFKMYFFFGNGKIQMLS